jgi:hypothetical protein
MQYNCLGQRLCVTGRIVRTSSLLNLVAVVTVDDCDGASLIKPSAVKFRRKLTERLPIISKLTVCINVTESRTASVDFHDSRSSRRLTIGKATNLL